MSVTNIMIVDDHRLVREGVKKILESYKGIKVVSEAENGVEALKMIPSIKPDIILLDIKMPKLNGLDTLKRIKDFDNSSKIIILSAYSNKEYIIDAIKRGANGYLLKSCTSENLIQAINRVNRNSSYLQPSLVKVLREVNKKDYIEPVIDKLSLLSNREYEILYLIAKGYNNMEIGLELFISEKTVKNHITNIYKKIDVKNRVQAVIFSYECELIPR